MNTDFNKNQKANKPRRLGNLKIKINYILNIIVIISLILASCGGAKVTPTQTPLPWIDEVTKRQKAEEQYLQSGIGSWVIDILRETGAFHTSPYLLGGAFSLDTEWYSNRIRSGRFAGLSY